MSLSVSPDFSSPSSSFFEYRDRRSDSEDDSESSMSESSDEIFNLSEIGRSLPLSRLESGSLESVTPSAPHEEFSGNLEEAKRSSSIGSCDLTGDVMSRSRGVPRRRNWKVILPYCVWMVVIVLAMTVTAARKFPFGLNFFVEIFDPSE